MSISIPPGTDPFALLGQLRADLKASLMYVVAWMAIVVFDYVEYLPFPLLSFLSLTICQHTLECIASNFTSRNSLHLAFETFSPQDYLSRAVSRLLSVELLLFGCAAETHSLGLAAIGQSSIK